MNKNFKILHEFPTIEDLNALFKRVKFPRADKQDYEMYKNDTCYSLQIRDQFDLIAMAYVTKPQYKGDSYMIYAVAVDPDYQNCGPGSFLINNIINWYNLQPSNKPPLSLYCNTSLINFYTKFGFINESIHQMVYQEWAHESSL
jgi:predicted GNAT family N-acyltransferase